MTMHPDYIPGVCNIGSAEVAKRRSLGVVGVVVTLLAWGTMLVLDVPAMVLAITFVMAFLAATGFLQARRHFCPGYGMHAMTNFSDTIGAHENVIDPADAATDKVASRQLTLHAVLIAAAVAVVAVASAIAL